jgi:hypothetical protein
MFNNNDFINQTVKSLIKGDISNISSLKKNLLKHYEDAEINYEKDEDILRILIYDLGKIAQKLGNFNIRDICYEIYREREIISTKLRNKELIRDWKLPGYITVFFKGIWNLISDYGLSAGRMILSAFITIYIYSFLYLTVNYFSVLNTASPALRIDAIYNIFSYLYLSALTFLPSGVNTLITPITPLAQFLVISEVILGYFFIFSLIFIFIKRTRLFSG